MIFTACLYNFIHNIQSVNEVINLKHRHIIIFTQNISKKKINLNKMKKYLNFTQKFQNVGSGS